MDWKEIVEYLVILGAVIGAGMASYFNMLAHGGTGWIITGEYPERWIIVQTFISLSLLTGISRWQLIWAFNVLLWWFSLIAFSYYMDKIGVQPRYRLLATLLPLFTVAIGTTAYAILDSLLFFTTLVWVWTLSDIKNEWQQIPFNVILSIVVLILVPPVEAGASMLDPVYFEYMIKKFLMSAHIFLPLAVIGMIRAPKQLYKPLLTLPAFIIVALIAVDWYRWWLMAAPLWVPFIVNLLDGITEFQ